MYKRQESDWRTANTQNYQDVFSEDAGYSLDLVDCDNDNAAQLEAVRTFISKDMDYIVIAPIQSAGWDTVLQEMCIRDRTISAARLMPRLFTGVYIILLNYTQNRGA